MANPAPLIEAELTVTGDVPDEVRVSGFVDAVFSVTLPKLRLVALIVSTGLAAAELPCRLTTVVLPVEELLLIVSCPLALPVWSDRTALEG